MPRRSAAAVPRCRSRPTSACCTRRGGDSVRLVTDAPDLVDQILALDPGHRDIAAFSTRGAAAAAARALRGARRVLIVTGFTVEPNMPLLEAVLKTLDEPADVMLYPAVADGARRLLASEKPTHLVAIE